MTKMFSTQEKIIKKYLEIISEDAKLSEKEMNLSDTDEIKKYIQKYQDCIDGKRKLKFKSGKLIPKEYAEQKIALFKKKLDELGASSSKDEEEETHQCELCGSEVKDKSNFCGECGAANIKKLIENPDPNVISKLRSHCVVCFHCGRIFFVRDEGVSECPNCNHEIYYDLNIRAHAYLSVCNFLSKFNEKELTEEQKAFLINTLQGKVTLQNFTDHPLNLKKK